MHAGKKRNRDADMVDMLSTAPTVEKFNSIFSQKNRKRARRLPVIRMKVDLKLNPEVSLRETLKKKGYYREKKAGKEEASNLTDQSTGAAADIGSGPAKVQKARYNVIEKLERQFGGGVLNSDSEDEAGSSEITSKKQPKLRFAQDYYNTEDPFIDDSELLEKEKAKEKSKRIKTQHGGFFVNMGDIQATEEKPPEPAPVKPVKKKRKRLPSSDEWIPTEEQKAALREFQEDFIQKKAAEEIPKNLIFFPHCLDAALRKMDWAIRRIEVPDVPVPDPCGREPQLWRNRGYPREIKKILGIGENRIKISLKRVELHWRSDQARTAKVRARQEFEKLVQEAVGKNKDKDKDVFASNKELKLCLKKVFDTLATFIEKANLYREYMVRAGIPRKKVDSEKKKNQWRQLSLRKQRKKTFEELAALFPEGTMTLSILRNKLLGANKLHNNTMAPKSNGPPKENEIARPPKEKETAQPPKEKETAPPPKEKETAPPPKEKETAPPNHPSTKEIKQVDPLESKLEHSSKGEDPSAQVSITPKASKTKGTNDASKGLAEQKNQKEKPPGKEPLEKVGKESTKRVWTARDGQLLLEGLKLYGKKPTKLAHHVPGKTPRQVSKFISTKFEKWGVHFGPSGEWEESCDAKFFAGLNNYLNNRTGDGSGMTTPSPVISTPKAPADSKNSNLKGKPFEVVKSFKTPPHETTKKAKEVKQNGATVIAEKKEGPISQRRSPEKGSSSTKPPTPGTSNHERRKAKEGPTKAKKSEKKKKAEENSLLPLKSSKFENPPSFSKSDFEIVNNKASVR